jgi:hypothetical protein
VPRHYREDATLGAQFDRESGVYMDSGESPSKLTYFDLAVALGADRDRRETLVPLAQIAGIFYPSRLK